MKLVFYPVVTPGSHTYSIQVSLLLFCLSLFVFLRSPLVLRVHAVILDPTSPERSIPLLELPRRLC